MDQVQTGDVVLMSSITPFAVLVKWCLASEYNHIAVAIRIDPTFLPDIKVVQNGGRLCLIEFNGDDYKNVLTNEIHHGNRLVQFTDLLDKYKKIEVLKLNPALVGKDFYKKTEHFIMENCLTICQMDLCTPILCILGISREENRETPKFCSELVTKYYQTLIPGSLDHTVKWLPSHFGKANSAIRSLFIEPGVIIKEIPHPYMDFFWNPWAFGFIVILVIVIIYAIIVLYIKN
jgi:hypothetical protein